MKRVIEGLDVLQAIEHLSRALADPDVDVITIRKAGSSYVDDAGLARVVTADGRIVAETNPLPGVVMPC